jgi:xanthine dehydrogenase/oxidase
LNVISDRSLCTRLIFGNPVQIFPPELKSYKRGYLHVQYHDKLSNQTVSWYRPDSLATALKLKSEIAGLRPIVGATEITVERSLKHVLPSNYLYLGDLPELMSIEVTQTGIKIGGSAPLTRVIDSLQILIRSLPEHKTRPFVAMREQLRFYGSNQIRNVACLAGNIATASPISYDSSLHILQHIIPIILLLPLQGYVTNLMGRWSVFVDSERRR